MRELTVTTLVLLMHALLTGSGRYRDERTAQLTSDAVVVHERLDDGARGQRWRLAHELWHLVLHLFVERHQARDGHGARRNHRRLLKNELLPLCVDVLVELELDRRRG